MWTRRMYMCAPRLGVRSPRVRVLMSRGIWKNVAPGRLDDVLALAALQGYPLERVECHMRVRGCWYCGGLGYLYRPVWR